MTNAQMLILAMMIRVWCESALPGLAQGFDKVMAMAVITAFAIYNKHYDPEKPISKTNKPPSESVLRRWNLLPQNVDISCNVSACACLIHAACVCVRVCELGEGSGRARI